MVKKFYNIDTVGQCYVSLLVIIYDAIAITLVNNAKKLYHWYQCYMTLLGVIYDAIAITLV
jgi:hypothetical protein